MDNFIFASYNFFFHSHFPFLVFLSHLLNSELCFGQTLKHLGKFQNTHSQDNMQDQDRQRAIL
jgi:hypothetical protein